MTLSLDEQIVWSRIENLALQQEININFRYSGLTHSERMKLLLATEEHLTKYPGQPFDFTFSKPWYDIRHYFW